ncbi:MULTISPECIES: hypothetical protein [Methylobacteriaceae]|uniref:hypothetical protein n=1 Tax=Methylobacteriaceae TaxID=119045 RepID=UPI00074F888D|nr:MULTISPECIES: hypothetical protein [Methylobacteriaceae]AMB44700.1 hypothetical protein Y590_07335 [Methylobacterium sp. AMS5]TFZ60794.1 hypothetical protein E4V01_02995 [Methylorubrum sp. Q1]
MRPVLFLTLLLSSACAAGGALAQQGSNWIDPPAKSGPAPAGGERAKPAAKSAPRFEAEPEAAPRSRRAAAASHSPARRDMHRQDRTRAAEMRRARRAAIRERAREESHAHTARMHRPAPPPAANMARAEPDPRFSDWAVAARRLSLGYLDSVSAPNGAMLSAAPRFYGSTVRFHGRVMTINALLSEKRRFALRWPERRYEPHGEPRIACDGPSGTCLVRIVHDFTAVSPARGARSQGVAELTLTVSFAGGAPVIVSESSRVLSRAGA